MTPPSSRAMTSSSAAPSARARASASIPSHASLATFAPELSALALCPGWRATSSSPDGSSDPSGRTAVLPRRMTRAGASSTVTRVTTSSCACSVRLVTSPDPFAGGLQTIVACPSTYPPAPGMNPTSRSRCCRRTSGSQARPGASTSMGAADILSGIDCAARHSRKRAFAPSRTANAPREP